MKRRPITTAERQEFEKAFSEARPISTKQKRTTGKSAPGNSPRPTSAGLDGRTIEKLQRGLFKPQARLDLHGYTAAAAHRALLGFLRDARRRGLRIVLVVTGRGAPITDSESPLDLGFDRAPRGILKSAVPRWLGEIVFADLVAGARPAHRRHGGDGALYVYLRKNSP